MGLGAYFRERKAVWAVKQERAYDRTMKFMGISQENYSLVTGAFLLMGLALGLSVLFFHSLIGWNPLAFVGLLMAVLIGSTWVVNAVIKRAMKKAGV